MNNIKRIIKEYENKGPKFHIAKLKNEVLEYRNELPGISEDVLEDLFLFKESISEIPKCPICDSNKRFKNYKYGYYMTCDKKECRDKNCANSIKSSFIKKYGVDNPSQVKSISDKRKSDFKTKYGVENPYQLESVKDKIKETWIEIHGVDNPNKSKKVRDKINVTNLEKYGVENAYQIPKVLQKIKDKFGDNFGFGSDFFKDKSKKTCQEKYDIDHPGESKEFHEKISKTQENKYGGRGWKSETTNKKIKAKLKENYGVEHPMQSDAIKKRIEDTCIERYGSASHMHNTDIFNNFLKSVYKTKQYILPSGKCIKVQGYENIALDYLFKMGYQENDLIIKPKQIDKQIGKIFYIKLEKQHRYYPDIYIKSENKIIEVKSTYTYENRKDINLLKQRACLDKGLQFEFLIITPEFLKQNNLIK